LTVRTGPRVERMRFDALEDALGGLDDRVRELAGAAEQTPAPTQLKHYEAADQVVARLELSGPERRLSSVHAGVDVRGDGSTQAYLGRVRRRLIDRGPGEDDLAAVRRELTRR
jgi:hypothetical protein